MVLNVDTFPTTCRCCLERDLEKQLHPLFSTSTELPLDDGQMQNAATQTRMSPTDKLPQVICTSCLQKKQDVETFQKMCIQSDNILRKLIEIKAEKPFDAYEMPESGGGVIVKEEIDIMDDHDEDAQTKDDNSLWMAESFEEETIMKQPINIPNTNFASNDIPKQHELAVDKMGLNAYLNVDNPLSNDLSAQTETYKCDQCDMRFVSVEYLQNHMQTHTGDQQFICKYCDRVFTESSPFNKHIFSHLQNDIVHRRRTNKPNHLNHIIDAVKDVLINKNSTETVAIARNISKTHLYRYIATFSEANVDLASTTNRTQLRDIAKTCYTRFYYENEIFTVQQEIDLKKYINIASAVYYGISLDELKTFAIQYITKIDNQYQWKSNLKPSNQWLMEFIKRQPQILLRTAELESSYRKKGFCKEHVDVFFKKLIAAQKNKEEVLNAENIWNISTTILTTVPSLNSLKFKTTALNDKSIFMTLGISADGKWIPPYFVTPKTKLRGHTTAMSADEFSTFLTHFIKYTKTTPANPTLLLVSEHTFQLSIDVIDMLRENGISLVAFPPYCAQEMQPLDISVFEPFKNRFQKQCQAWTDNHIGQNFGLQYVPLVANKCLDAAVMSENISYGFRAAGIYPLNPKIFKNIDFDTVKEKKAVPPPKRKFQQQTTAELSSTIASSRSTNALPQADLSAENTVQSKRARKGTFLKVLNAEEIPERGPKFRYSIQLQ